MARLTPDIVSDDARKQADFYVRALRGPWGGMWGKLTDPFGVRWQIATD